MIEFAIMAIIIQVILILFIQKDTVEKSAIIFPLSAMIVLVLVNQILSKDKNLTEYAFFFSNVNNRDCSRSRRIAIQRIQIS